MVKKHLRQPLKTPRRHLRCPFSAWTALSSPHAARLRFGSWALPVKKIASESGSAVFLEVALIEHHS